jgi:hypothetical protein
MFSSSQAVICGGRAKISTGVNWAALASTKYESCSNSWGLAAVATGDAEVSNVSGALEQADSKASKVRAGKAVKAWDMEAPVRHSARYWNKE